MPTAEEIQAKHDATRLNNLLAKATKMNLSKGDKTLLKTLYAKALKADSQKYPDSDADAGV